ncbi:hypothetical protein [Streptomyces sp. NPDC058731]|uniref:hypothetical protein n=1 Tax=Streptomyces sp. NPDC058731 TaxID=3346613 RepID=UPI0036A8F71F
MYDTPSGFIEDVLGESIWSRQREIVDATPFKKRIAVPAGLGVGKTVAANSSRGRPLFLRWSEQ